MRLHSQLAFSFFALSLLALPTQLMAQDPSLGQPVTGPQDALTEHFFNAPFILSNASQIGLDEGKTAAIQGIVDAMEKKVPTIQEELKAQMDTFGELLSNNPVDETAVLNQLDNVLKQERKIKRVHLISLMKIRAELTPEQQTALKGIRTKMIQDQQAIQQRLQAKAMQIQQAAQRMFQAGQQPTALVQALQEAQQKGRTGDIAGAEAALDKALSQIGGAQPQQGFQLQQ